jgi:DNA polymerase
VDHGAGLVLLGIDVPEFLDADAIDLRLAVGFEVELLLDLLGQAPARALGEEGVASVKLHARLIVVAVRAVAGDAHGAGRDALHRAVLMIQDLGRGEAREDLDA